MAARNLPMIVYILLCNSFYSYAAEFYVSPNGHDGNPGTIEKPLLTIQRAALKMQAGDTCYLREGWYREKVILKNRSGTRDAPITFVGYPGELAVIDGTVLLNLKWSVYEGSIYKTELKQPITQLFVDGELMTEARWPNMSFDQRWDRDVWRIAGSGSRYGLMIDPQLKTTGIDWTGGVATLNVGQWQTWRRTVQNHSIGSDRFEYKKNLGAQCNDKPDSKWGGFDRYFLGGKLEALDSPGEWFWDEDSKIIYLWTPDDTNPKQHHINGKVRGYGLIAEDVDYIHFSNIHFFATAFKLDNVRYCEIHNVHLLYPSYLNKPFKETIHGLRAPEEPEDWWGRFVGESSIGTPVYLKGIQNTILNSSIRYAQGSPIVISGAANTMENCLIHDCDWYGLDQGHGVDLGDAAKFTLKNCTIYNIGSSEGVTLKNGTVQYNYIHHAGLCQSDGALINSSGPEVAGSNISYNWLHDHNAFNYGGGGIRGDWASTGLIVHHNVIWDCASRGILTNGDNNRIYNNTCLNPEGDIMIPLRPHFGEPVEYDNGNSKTINNLAERIEGTFEWEQYEPTPGEVHHNYSGDNPMLEDPENLDFRPKAGSPLIDAGVEINGITDGFTGDAPDIGAYEYGGEHWVAGITWDADSLVENIVLELEHNSPGQTPASFELFQNYPNPFNGTTNITFQLSESGRVKIKVYDILGREVITLADQSFSKDEKQVIPWNGQNHSSQNVSSGFYFIQMEMRNQIKGKKCVYMK